MTKVRRLVAAGASIPTAIKESLGMQIKEVALKHRRNAVSLGQVILGRRQPTVADIAVLIRELGGTEQEWRTLLYEAGRPGAKAG